MLQKLSIFKGKLVVFRIIQVKKLDNSRKKLKTQGKNSKLKTKTQGFGKVKNAVCRKRVQKKPVTNEFSYLVGCNKDQLELVVKTILEAQRSMLKLRAGPIASRLFLQE